MKTQELKNKKITLATLKAFVKKANDLYVMSHSSFDGMSDCVQQNNEPKLIPVSKENAIGIKGVYLVGGSRNYFQYVETDTHFGINVYNCCGSETLFTSK
jgi:hypothetical protein